MIMKNISRYICIAIFTLCSAVFSLSCKKELPEPGNPGNDDWLLSKIFSTSAGGEFLRQEFIYGDNGRPWLDITYGTPGTFEPDTLKVDTLLYNAAGQLVQVNSVNFYLGTTYQRKTVRYNTAGRIDTVRLYDPTRAAPLLYTLVYTYSANARVVNRYSFQGNGNFSYDSVRYTYDNMRNLSEIMQYPVLVEISLRQSTYSQYDDCDNIYSHLNMNVYLPSDRFYSGLANTNLPFISKNNPRIMEVMYHSPQDIEAPSGMFESTITTYIPDSLRLIRSAVVAAPGGETRYRYEYIAAP
jgi:hypothetical protein